MSAVPMNLAPHIADVLAGALLAGVWQGALLVGSVALLLRVLPRLSATMRSAVWFGVFGLLVLLPVVAAARELAADAEPGSRGMGAPLHASSTWAVALVAVWGALALLRAAQLARSAWALRGISRRAEPLPGLGAEGAGEVPVYTSDEVAVPSVIGFFSPRIVLPVGLPERLSADELRAILLHEAEHLRRRDDWTNLLQKLGVVLFPVHPVLLWVERQLCRERELACDDGVLRRTGAPRSYAATLANLAEFALVRRGVSLALGAWGRRPELLLRVERILARPAKPLGRRATGAALAGVLAASAAGAVELARSPELIRFGARPMVLEASGSEHPASRLAPGFRAQEVVYRPAERRVPVRAVVARPLATRQEGARRRDVRMQKRTFALRVDDGLGGSSVVVLTAWRWTGVSGSGRLVERTGGHAVPEIPLIAQDAMNGAPGSMIVPPGSAAVSQVRAQAVVRETVYRSSRPAAQPEKEMQSSGFTYAAVPVQGGWLIVQL